MGTVTRSLSTAVGVILTGAVFLLALWPSGCNRPVTPPSPATFVGNAACTECHKHEFEAHRNSRHARSLHVASVSELGKLAPPAGPIGDSGAAIQHEGDTIYMTTPSNGKKVKLALALGSGKSGITFVGINDDSTVTEGRMSYFPGKKVWYITPGHEYNDRDTPGFKHEPDTSRQCLTCHTITVPKDLKVERKFFGIGCETCHGPGSAHIEAARRKDKNLLMEKMSDWSAERINEACGKCHRSSQGIGTSGVEITMTNRFQAYGISQSKCFTGTRNNLSCINCHSPHEDAATDPKYYEAICLTCHNGAKTKPDEPANRACPVNPKEKCVSCHMPMRKVFPHSTVPIEMADHLIWAYGKKAGAHAAH